MSTFILATDNCEFEQRVREALNEPNGSIQRLGSELLQLRADQAADALTGDPELVPDVVAIGPDVDEQVALALARALDERGEVEVILVAPPLKALLEQAMRVGVRDVVGPDASREQLRQALNRARRSAARHRPTAGAGREPGRVITIVSPKGGSGKTMLSTNLAVALARSLPHEVVLADYDLQFGDVASSLRLLHEQAVTNVLHARDAMTVKAALTEHESGLFALCAPENPAEAEQVTGEHITRLTSLLASEFKAVVIDTSAGLTEHTLSALEVSTDILFVCTMDVPSVRSLRKLVVALDQIGMTTQQRHFVLNRTQSRVGLDEDDVARTVALPISVALPSTRSVPLSMNQGIPLVDAEPRSAAAKQITELASQFLPEPARRREPKRVWRRN
jgi:pilus assembly protein CpaE